MKQTRLKKVFLFLKRKVQNFSYHKAIVFVICLALSSFLWLLNSLEKKYTNRINVPVTYIDFPKDKQLSGALPASFDLIVDAYGYTLLSYKLRLVFSPVLLSVNELIDNSYSRSNKYKYIILTVSHKEEIEKQISSEIKILSIKPDSLIFNFSKVISRKIKVEPSIKTTFENQYSLEKKPFTEPDSILVTGPLNLIDTLSYVPTIDKTFSRLSHTTTANIGIKPLLGAKTDISEVKLTIPVEQITEVSFEVPIKIVNKPSDVVLKTFPGKVKVTCRIGLSKYKKLDYSNFQASVNYDQSVGKSTRLPVLLEAKSQVFLSTDYSPKEVEYVLEH
jgi:YbbR domain-containing protein